MCPISSSGSDGHTAAGLTELVERVIAALSAIAVPVGSAEAKAIAAVRGTADAYLHSGGQYEWDFCAPDGTAAGLHVARPNGTALRYDRPDPY